MEGSSMAQFKVLSHHLSGETEINQKMLSQDSKSPGQDLNPGLFEYEAEC
jgi:hypothetical protein